MHADRIHRDPDSPERENEGKQVMAKPDSKARQEQRSSWTEIMNEAGKENGSTRKIRGYGVTVHWTRKRKHKAKRAEKGNTRRKTTATGRSDAVKIRLCNVNGLQEAGRLQQVLGEEEDVKVMTETHTTEATQKALGFEAEGHRIIWGSPVEARKRTGVAIAVRNDAHWGIRKVEWKNKNCLQHEKEGRLVATELYRGGGKQAMIVYAVYGIAGSRWELKKKEATEKIIKDVIEDATARGSIPTYICGDMNITTEESGVLRRLVNNKEWYDANIWGSRGKDETATSTKGQGARIDLILVNKVAANGTSGYAVTSGVNDRDHKAVVCKADLKYGKETRTVAVKAGGKVEYERKKEADEDIAMEETQEIKRLLKMRDIDGAYKCWSRNAEETLRRIPKKDRQETTGAGRGKIRLREETVAQKSQEATTATMWTRRLAKMKARLEEVARAKAIGHKEEAAWKNAKATLHELQELGKNGAKGKEAQEVARWAKKPSIQGKLKDLEKTMRETTGSEKAKEGARIAKHLLEDKVQEEGRQRIKAWKAKLQSQEKERYKWLKGGSKEEETTMPRKDGTVTANMKEQLKMMKEEWAPIFEKFADHPPDVESFMRDFKGNMKTAKMKDEELTTEQVRKAAEQITESAAGLDQWQPGELRALMEWSTDCAETLTCIFNSIEEDGRWPKTMYKASTSLIPKPTGKPRDYRPITVLSAVYRLWAKARFSDLLVWQEGWAPETMFGCRKGKGPEGLALCVALDMEAGAYEQDAEYVGGIAYDFKKAFDLVPWQTMLSTMRHRGATERVMKPLEAMYGQLERAYKLRGELGDFHRSSNGIMQGCPLSMIGLNALVASVLESIKDGSQNEQTQARTYADDISATVKAKGPEELREEVRRVHSVVRAYEARGCGEISSDKTHTFGDDCLKGLVEHHEEEFRLVGGFIRTEQSEGGTTGLERKRMEKYIATVERARKMPVSWEERAKALVATQTQMTYGQGTHTLSIKTDDLKKLRTKILQALWDTDFYSASPHIVFALLAPTQLEPQVAMRYHGLRTVARAMKDDKIASQLRERMGNKPTKAVDGPTARLKGLLVGDTQGELVKELLEGMMRDEHEWAHRLREGWREEMWGKVRKDRPEQYGDAEDVDKTRTMALYRELKRIADDESDYVAANEARAQLGVLRKLLAGGLMSRERNARHRKSDKKEDRMCRCGAAEATVQHVTWECVIHKDVRNKAQKEYGWDRRSMHKCTKYAGIIPGKSKLTQAQAKGLQRMMVNIWQEEIRSWYSGAEYGEVATPRSASGVHENGHVLAKRDGGKEGVWCKKCGKYVTLLKHIRLKITSKPCEAPEGQWLEKEGFHKGRVEEAERDLNEKYNNGHTLEWNHKFGKVIGSEEEGKIWCTICKKQWRWKDRHLSLARTVCTGPPEGEETEEDRLAENKAGGKGETAETTPAGKGKGRAGEGAQGKGKAGEDERKEKQERQEKRRLTGKQKPREAPGREETAGGEPEGHTTGENHETAETTQAGKGKGRTGRKEQGKEKAAQDERKRQQERQGVKRLTGKQKAGEEKGQEGHTHTPGSASGVNREEGREGVGEEGASKSLHRPGDE